MQNGIDLRFVLVKPVKAGNVGSAVRAVANMGIGRVVVVDEGGLGGREGILADMRAREMAAGALEPFLALDVTSGIPAAVEGCSLSIGFTARPRIRREPRMVDLPDAVPEIVEALARGPVALLFGPEDRGLNNQELAGCGLLVRIPASEAHPVLNLASSVLVTAYEIARALRPAAAPADVEPLATIEEIGLLSDRFKDVFTHVSFLRSRTHQGIVTLQGMLTRMKLQKREYRFLMGAMHLLDRSLRREAVPTRRPRAKRGSGKMPP